MFGLMVLQADRRNTAVTDIGIFITATTESQRVSTNRAFPFTSHSTNHSKSIYYPKLSRESERLFRPIALAWLQGSLCGRFEEPLTTTGSWSHAICNSRLKGQWPTTGHQVCDTCQGHLFPLPPWCVCMSIVPSLPTRDPCLEYESHGPDASRHHAINKLCIPRNTVWCSYLLKFPGSNE